MRTIRPEFYLAFASGHAAFLGLYVLVLGTHPIVDGLWAIGTATMGTLFLASFPTAPQKSILLAAIGLTILMSTAAEVPERITELQKLMVEVSRSPAAAPQGSVEVVRHHATVKTHIERMNSGEPHVRALACAEFRRFCAAQHDHRCEGYLERCDVVTTNPWVDPLRRKWSE